MTRAGADRYEPAPKAGPFRAPTTQPTHTATPSPSSTPTPSSTPIPTTTPIPTATPTPPAPPTLGPVYWAGMTEAQLAAFQQNQGSRNDCAEYAIAAGLNMLYGGAVRGSDVAAAADQVIRDHFLPFAPPWAGTRMSENGPTAPWQQANIVNGIARQGGLSLAATATHATAADLIHYLQQPDTAVVVTISWDDAHVPQIARASDAGTGAGGGAPLQLNAHAMLLAAYDPNHVDSSGNPAPWGFVNSWTDGSGGGTEIYWMPDADFQEAWSHPLPWPMGANNAVVITRTATSTVSATATPMPTTTPTPTPSATPTPGPRDRVR